MCLLYWTKIVIYCQSKDAKRHDLLIYINLYDYSYVKLFEKNYDRGLLLSSIKIPSNSESYSSQDNFDGMVDQCLGSLFYYIAFDVIVP